MRATHQPRSPTLPRFILSLTLPGGRRRPKRATHLLRFPIFQPAWKNLKAESVPVRATSDKVITRTDGRIPLLILSRNSVWPMRVFVLPREVRQKRRCASCAWEVDLLSSR